MASRRKQTRTMRGITSQTSAHAAWALTSLRWVSVAGLLVVDWANGDGEDEGEEKVGSHAKIVYLIEDYAPWVICIFVVMILACYCWNSYRTAATRVAASDQAEKTTEQEEELNIEDMFQKGEDAVSWMNVQQREGFREIRPFTVPSSDHSITDCTTDCSSDPSSESSGGRPRGQQKPPKVPAGSYSRSASDMEQQRLPMREEDSQSSGLWHGYDPRGPGLAVRKI